MPQIGRKKEQNMAKRGDIDKSEKCIFLSRHLSHKIETIPGIQLSGHLSET